MTSTRVGNSTDYIKASTAYDTASALATAVTDARGNSVQYGYSSTTRQQTTVTDANSNTSTYTYGDASAMLRLASLTSPTGTGSSTATVSYGYDTYGKLTDITRAGTVYSFTYDQWGRVVDTKVGNMTLSTNAYDQYGKLSSVTYGNGFVTEYVYDALDRVDEINQGTANNTVLTYKFIYNGEGDLYELRNYKTLRSTFFEYDHAGRCMASTEKSFTVSGNAVTYTGTVSGYRYEYDANNNLTKLTCSVNGSSWDTTYTYDKDNRPKEVLLAGGKTIVNTYDAIGRLTSRALKNGSVTVRNTAITYVPGADGSKTALVATYQNGTDAAYSYTYDANGNITEITQGSMSFTYVYDKANQLIRENLYYGSGNSNNATYTYEYDAWGNILNKKKYAYTTGTLGSVLNTKTYGYTNSQWGDLLTSYNGSTITYDAMGNMATYGSKSYTWEGKQLVEINVMNSLYYTFAYDENGLRTSKTTSWISGGTEETTEYFYNGSVLIGMNVEADHVSMRFSYDASGSVVSVDYSENDGITYTTYYYLRNAQNDIVKLIDGSGNTVVEYTYDSWGKQITVTGSLASSLGEYQPFRYRGYVYDEETDLYYLQSRYYDPKICRFISADVLLSTGQGVIGHNSFAYCNNSPVFAVDSNGAYPVAVPINEATEHDQHGAGTPPMIFNQYNPKGVSNSDCLAYEEFFNMYKKSMNGKEHRFNYAACSDFTCDVEYGVYYKNKSVPKPISNIATVVGLAGLAFSYIATKGTASIVVGIISGASLVPGTIDLFLNDNIPTGYYTIYTITYKAIRGKYTSNPKEYTIVETYYFTEASIYTNYKGD